MCNFITDTDRLKGFAIDHGFAGIDWSFDLENLPAKPSDETRWVDFLTVLEPLEVRFHCPFIKIDIGHEDPRKGRAAVALFRRVIKLVSKANGKFFTLHIGLGRDSTLPLSWNDTVQNLRQMVHYGAERGVTVCLENLLWGWTSKPNLFEKLIRLTGAGVTFDIGHAHACEAVVSQHFTAEDFVSPHRGRVFNAHLYDTEIPGVGHLPARELYDIRDRLDILSRTDCRWWVIEVRDVGGLLQTKAVVDAYLKQRFSKDATIGRR
jgi:sugar phosphate isomerase/epimerase